jgi:hypothetical protein
MSQPNSPDPSALPNAILVQPAVYARRVKRKGGKWRETLPWTKILIGGCVTWLAATLFIGLYAVMTAGTEPIDLDDEPLPPLPGKIVNQEPLGEPKKPAAPLAQIAPKKAAPKAAANDEFVECARIGTEVKFLKDPTDAFKRARAEKKMVFMVHLSGNLEDQEFT